MTTKEAVEELKSMKYGLGKMLLLCLLFPESVIKLNKDRYGKAIHGVSATKDIVGIGVEEPHDLCGSVRLLFGQGNVDFNKSLL